MLIGSAAALSVIALLGVVAHFSASAQSWAVGVSAFGPYLMLAAPVAAVLAGFARQWLLLAVAALLIGGAMLLELPLYVAAPAPADSVTLRVMTANLRLGSASPQAVVSAVRTHHVDVVMLEELTPGMQSSLDAAGLADVLPYAVSDPREAGCGTGMWSRYPLAGAARRTDFTFAFVAASVLLPRHPPVFTAALHLPAPWPDSARWNRDIAHLPAVLPGFGADGGAVIVGGDFNATPDSAQFRRLLVAGYADAADQAGAGMTRTYPADRWYPPLIAIDHVLARHAVARSVETVRIAGSDHRALLVAVAVPA